MKIEHTTYNEVRCGKSTARPVSATKKVKDYFSRISYQSEDSSPTSAGAERPTTMWPRMDIAASDDLPEMTAYLTQQNRTQRKAEKEKKTAATTSTNSTKNPLPPKVPGKTKKVAPTITTSSTKKALPPLPKVPGNKKPEIERAPAPALLPIKKPSLIRKPNFIKEKLANPENQRRRISSVENLAKLQILRTKIREGKLEKVVPPPSSSFSEGRLAPPRPAENPFLGDTLSRSSSKKTALQSGKNSSASSKVVSLIETSADFMDETRREIAGKFRPPFEHLNYQAWWDEKIKERKGSEGSTESFCCVGEGEPKKEKDKMQALKQRQTKNDKRISGEGTSPWVKVASSNCRLCGKGGVGGVRSLCRECENDFMRPEGSPKVDHHSSWTSSYYSEEEVKPIPPLKDRNTLLLQKRMNEDSASIPHIHQLDQYDPELLLKSGRPSQPKLHEPTPKRPISQRAIFDYKSESESEEEEKHRNWQTRSMKYEFEKSQKLFSRWSGAFGNGGLREEEVPLVGKGKKEIERDNHFYDFYDDLLEDEVEPRAIK